MTPTPVSLDSLTLLLPTDYSLTTSSTEGFQASNPSGDLLQLRTQALGIPRPMLSLLRHNRAQFLQILSAQAPALLKQAIAKEAELRSTPIDTAAIDSRVVNLPSGAAVCASTQITIRGARRTFALWLLSPPSLQDFYVLSLSAALDLVQAQALLASTLDSLRFQD